MVLKTTPQVLKLKLSTFKTRLSSVSSQSCGPFEDPVLSDSSIIIVGLIIKLSYSYQLWPHILFRFRILF